MIIPPRENLEKIFRIYNNQCSFGDCLKTIIDLDNHVNGNILFVESNKKESPRFNSKLTNQQMIDYTNLIMFCDIHCWEVDKDPERFTGKGLKIKLENDLKKIADSNFELSDQMYDEFLHHFVIYHDPDRFSHVRTYLPLFDEGAGDGGIIYDFLMCDDVFIKPKRNQKGGKFEIIDSRRKIQESDKVIFYPKDDNYSNGIHAEIEIKSSMRIEGIIPELPNGEYLITVRSSEETSRLEDDFKFEII